MLPNTAYSPLIFISKVNKNNYLYKKRSKIKLETLERKHKVKINKFRLQIVVLSINLRNISVIKLTSGYAPSGL